MSSLNLKPEQPTTGVPDAKESEHEKLIHPGVKTATDVVGFAPVVGNVASIGSAVMSGAELAYQYKKGNKAGMKEAAIDLAADTLSVLATQFAGKAAKGAAKLGAKAASGGKVAAVLAKAGAHSDKLVKAGEKVVKVGQAVSTVGSVLGRFKKV